MKRASELIKQTKAGVVHCISLLYVTHVVLSDKTTQLRVMGLS